jgi:hypothetical protein
MWLLLQLHFEFTWVQLNRPFKYSYSSLPSLNLFSPFNRTSHRRTEQTPFSNFVSNKTLIMPAMYPNTPAKRNIKLYKLRSTRTRAASHAVHKVLKIDRRDRNSTKKFEAGNLVLRAGPLLETLEMNSFGRGKTNLRIDPTWANTARHRGIGKQIDR